MLRNSTLQKCGGRLHNSRNWFFAQFGIHRQRKSFLRGALRMRKIPRLVAEPRVQRLKMQWVRIINRASNFSLAQKFLEGITLFHANGVLVVDVFESFRRERRHDPGNLREEPIVFRGVRLAGAPAIRKMAEPYAQERRPAFLPAARSPPVPAEILF